MSFNISVGFNEGHNRNRGPQSHQNILSLEEWAPPMCGAAEQPMMYTPPPFVQYPYPNMPIPQGYGQTYEGPRSNQEYQNRQYMSDLGMDQSTRPGYSYYSDNFSNSNEATDSHRRQSWPNMADVTITGPHGSEYTLDQNNHMTSMRDEGNRSFRFAWDHQSNALNFVHNEQGDWQRQRGSRPGEYTNTWHNAQTHGTWTGDVQVGTVKDAQGHDVVGYSFNNDQSRRTYTISGVKSEETLHDGQPCTRVSENANGYRTTEDFRTHFTKREDPNGHLLSTSMTDALKHTYRFSNFDQHGDPRIVENASGKWVNVQGDEWVNQKKQTWHGQVHVNMNAGTYSYTDSSGRCTTKHSDGTSEESFQGNTRVARPDGTNEGYYSDGSPMPCDPISGSIKYDVNHGVTTRAHLSLHGADVDSDGNMRMDANAPVNAFERGCVVYSSADKERQNWVISLNPADMSVVHNLENEGKDVVVVETKDGRYDIYSGLGKANAKVGQWLDQDTIIGRAGDNGMANFSVHRQRISGDSVNVSQ